MAEFDGTHSRLRPPGIQVTCIIYIVLGVGSLLLRLFTRWRVTRRFGLDDVFMVLGTMFAVGMYASALVATEHYAMNRHQKDIPPRMLYKTLEMDYVYNFCFVEASYMSKLALLWFSRRLINNAFTSTLDPRRIALIFLLVFSVVCDCIYIVITLLECRPLRAAWDPNTDYQHTCIDTGLFLMVAGIINTLTDFCCTLLPASIVLKLHMPMRQRFAVASVFLVGISVNVASALRIYYSFHQYSTGDMWDMFQPYIAGNTEIGLGLLCVNAPVIRPLFVHYINVVRSFSQGTPRPAANPALYRRSHHSSKYNNTYSSPSLSRLRCTYDLSFDSNLLSSIGGEGKSFAVVEGGDSAIAKDTNAPQRNGIEVLQTVELYSRTAELDPIDEMEGEYRVPPMSRHGHESEESLKR